MIYEMTACSPPTPALVALATTCFKKSVGATLDARVDAQIIHHLHASADHPMLPNFPEGAYLKGLVLRVS